MPALEKLLEAEADKRLLPLHPTEMSLGELIVWVSVNDLELKGQSMEEIFLAAYGDPENARENCRRAARTTNDDLVRAFCLARIEKWTKPDRPRAA